MLHREIFHFAENACLYQPIPASIFDFGTRKHRKRYNTASARHHHAMKLNATATQQYQTVTGYDEYTVEINAQPFAFSLIVLPEVAPTAWPVASFDTLTLEHFAQIAAAEPDVVILGTGRKQRFVHPKLSAALTSRRVGIECMDNQAACRTYNILMAERRKVALALIIEAAAPGGQA